MDDNDSGNSSTVFIYAIFGLLMVALVIVAISGLANYASQGGVITFLAILKGGF